MKKIFLFALLVLSLFSLSISAQESENLYQKRYSKLSLVVQPSILTPSTSMNTDGSSYPSMDFTTDFSYQFGVYYHFFQQLNWNIKTGLLLKEFTPKFDLNINNADIGSGTMDHLLTQFDPYKTVILSIPLKADYYIPLNPEYNLVLGAGFNFNYFFGDFKDLQTTVSVNNTQVFFGQTVKERSVNLSYELAVGAQYKTTFALYELSFYVNNSLSKPYVSGIYYFENLNSTPYKSGDFTIKNNFFGLSLVVSPKKGWLDKK